MINFLDRTLHASNFEQEYVLTSASSSIREAGEVVLLGENRG